MENRWAALSLGHVSMANIPCMEFMPGSLAPLRGQRLRDVGGAAGQGPNSGVRGETLEPRQGLGTWSLWGQSVGELKVK